MKVSSILLGALASTVLAQASEDDNNAGIETGATGRTTDDQELEFKLFANNALSEEDGYNLTFVRVTGNWIVDEADAEVFTNGVSQKLNPDIVGESAVEFTIPIVLDDGQSFHAEVKANVKAADVNVTTTFSAEFVLSFVNGDGETVDRTLTASTVVD